MLTKLATAVGRAVLFLVLVFSSGRAAEAATLTFTTVVTDHAEYSWSNIDADWIHFSLGIPNANAVLPAFDPSLGTLQSALLEIDGGMLTTLFTHTGAPFGSVVTAAAAESHATLSSLDALFSTRNLSINHTTITAGDVRFVNPYAEASSTGFDADSFAHLYTASSLANFLGAPLGFVAGRPHPDSYFHLSAAPGQFFMLPDEDQDGHPFLFGDAHFDMQVRWDLAVTYTYEPFQAAAPVPEPASLLLLAAGLAGLAMRRRRA